MAFDEQSYGGSEFQMAIIGESVLGTGNVTTMQLVNVDVPLSFPDLNPVVDFPVKSGTGRTAKTLDKFVCETGTLRSIPFSATADKTVLPMLLSNIFTNTVDTGPAAWDAATQYLPPLLKHGRTSGTFLHSMTVAAPISPEGSNTVIFPGCVLQDLIVTIGGLEDRNGQAKISGTFITQYKPTFAQAAPSAMVAYPSTFYYLDDLAGAAKTSTFAGKANVVLDGLTITINNPSKYEGFQGANGDPESISRGLPGLSVMAAAILKYDSNTADLLEDYKDGGITAAIELGNHGTWASATVLGLKIAAGSINEQPALNDKSSMYIDCSVKALDNETDDLARIIA